MIKISETKWLDETEEYINSLSKSSAKKVRIVCPRCEGIRIRRWYDFVRNQTTFCKRCNKLQKYTDPMIGKKYGRLTVVSYAESKTKYSQFNVVCECGKEAVVLASHLKSGHTTSCGCAFMEGLRGSNNPTYNSSLTGEDRKRQRSGIGTWRKRVLERDNHTCQVCGVNEKLVAHHLNGYATNMDLALDLNNGVTVCRSCHTEFHNIFMGNYRTPVTTEDFEQFKEQF